MLPHVSSIPGAVWTFPHEAAQAAHVRSCVLSLRSCVEVALCMLLDRQQVRELQWARADRASPSLHAACMLLAAGIEASLSTAKLLPSSKKRYAARLGLPETSTVTKERMQQKWEGGGQGRGRGAEEAIGGGRGRQEGGGGRGAGVEKACKIKGAGRGWEMNAKKRVCPNFQHPQYAWACGLGGFSSIVVSAGDQCMLCGAR